MIRLIDSAFAGRVAPLEQDRELQPVFMHPVLELDQLALQAVQLALVYGIRDLLLRRAIGQLAHKPGEARLIDGRDVRRRGKRCSCYA